MWPAREQQRATTTSLATMIVGLLALVLCITTKARANIHGSEGDFGLIGSLNHKLNFLPSPMGSLEASWQSGGGGMLRNRRQISYPQLPQPQPQQQQPLQPQQPQRDSGMLGFLSNLGPQMEQAKMITSLFNSVSGTGQQQQQPARDQQQQLAAGGPSAGQLLSQLSDLIRSTQERTARTVADGQLQAQSASQQATEAARSAQGGIQSALAEMGQGLQRLAMNNPNLVPDIKSLYQSVSSKLNSVSSSVGQAATPMSSQIVPATTSEQFADNLAKVAIPGLQTPV